MSNSLSGQVLGISTIGGWAFLPYTSGSSISFALILLVRATVVMVLLTTLLSAAYKSWLKSQIL